VTNAIAELTQGFEEPFARLGSDASEDRDAVVISWPSVPVEIVRAAGFRPVVARGSARPTPEAEAMLETDVFPARLRQLVEGALTGRLEHVAAIVLPRTSDPDYKCFLYLRELGRRGTRLPPVLLYDLLHSIGPEVHEHDIARTRELFAQLARIAGRQPDADALRAEIQRADRARAAARRLDSLRSGPTRLTGVEALAVLGSRWQIGSERYAELAESVAPAVAAWLPIEGPRVLLAGAPVDTTALHAAVEAAGALVVAEMSPFGSAGIARDVESGDEPVAALADHYRDTALDARTPVATLMRRIENELKAVDAVIVSLPPDDQSFGWDYPRLCALLERHAIPHAVVRGDGALAPTADDRKRIEALVAHLVPRRESRHG
jgi:benzoyl-CoA reductase/2-hydroxyglutaryl-CoA dehydratase subunit BcrC/BadD/HgdB